MTPQAWAALRRWHREQKEAAHVRFMRAAPLSDDEIEAQAAFVAHSHALTEMTRLVRLTRAASRKGKQTNG
jgi:hypothetical protein